jgi:hypothetical protein
MSRFSGTAFMLAFVLFGTLRAGAQTVLEPENQQVALAGRLRYVHGYGPPGYGENKKVDTLITYWILELPNPVNTICTPEKPEWKEEECGATKTLKLFFPTLPANNGLEVKAKAMKGRRVIATGILRRADTVGEITPSYMDVTEIQPVRTSPNP